MGVADFGRERDIKTEKRKKLFIGDQKRWKNTKKEGAMMDDEMFSIVLTFMKCCFMHYQVQVPEEGFNSRKFGNILMYNKNIRKQMIVSHITGRKQTTLR